MLIGRKIVYITKIIVARDRRRGVDTALVEREWQEDVRQAGSKELKFISMDRTLTMMLLPSECGMALGHQHLLCVSWYNGRAEQ